MARNSATRVVVIGSKRRTHLRAKKTLMVSGVTAMLGLVALIATTPAASARIVCNSYGDCWHTDTRYDYDRYDRGQHARYHPDDWYFHQNWNDEHDRHYREGHEGRGYYKSGVWIQF